MQRGHVGVCDILKHKMDEILTLSKYNAKDLHNAKRQNAFDLAVHTGQQSVVCARAARHGATRDSLSRLDAQALLNETPAPVDVDCCVPFL